MQNLLALQTARTCRELGRFYGEASSISVTPTTKKHFQSLCELCESWAYMLEKSLLPEPEPQEGGGLRPIIGFLEDLPAQRIN